MVRERISNRAALRAACLTVVAGMTGPALADVVASRINPGNGHTYSLIGLPNGSGGFNGLTWTSAQAQSLTLGGNLATINSQAENDWITRVALPYTFEVWMGINDQASSGNFVWVSGKPVVYTNWEPGQPDNIGTEHFGQMFLFDSGRWNNSNSTDTSPLGLAESNSSVARFDWNKAAGGAFAAGTNWTPSGPPGTSDGAYFALNSTYTVTFAGATTNALNVIEAGNVTQNLGGFTRTATETYVAPQAGQTATLTPTNGTLAGSYMTLGDASGSSGTLNVGSGAVVNMSQTIFAGNQGAATVSITSGGKVRAGNFVLAAQSNASLTVDGAGSSLGAGNITFAGSGTATINVTNTATIHADTSFFIGDGATSTASLSVSGAGSSITSGGEFTVGRGGNGNLTLIDSAVATTGNVFIGGFGSGNGFASVSAGATWNGTQDINVGASGSGVLQVSGGGHVSTTGTYFVGGDTGGLGFVSVSGVGSTLTAAADLTIGDFGQGAALIGAGASAHVNSVFVGGASGGAGTLTIADPTTSFTANSSIAVGNDSFTSGTLNIHSTTVSIGNDLSVGTGGNGFATIDGGAHVTSTFLGVARFNSGTIGVLNISGAGTTLNVNGDMNVGETSGSTGTLTVQSGAALTAHFIGIGTGGSGSVGTLVIATGGAVTASSDVQLFSPQATLQMAGGTLTAPDVNLLDNGSTIAGFGTVNAAIHFTGNISAAGGTLTLGDATRTDGFSAQGSINVGPNAILNLLDANQADFFAPVVLNNGVLIARHGITIGGNPFTGFGVVVGNPDTPIASITGTVILSTSFDVGAQTAHVYSIGPASFGPLTTISGGNILSPTGLLLANGSTISGNGFISANTTLANGILSAPAGTALTVLGTLSGYGVTIGTINVASNQLTSPTGSVDLATGLNIGNRTANVYSIGLAHLGGTTTLAAGANLNASNGITLNAGDQISGAGSITANVVLAGGYLRAAGGALVVGGTVSGFGIVNSNVSATTFLSPAGNLTIASPISFGSDAATLRSQNPAAVLAPIALAGGSVTSTSGIDLKPGGSITGAGSVGGQLIAGGGNVSAAGGTITFSGSVIVQGNPLNLTGPVVNAGTLNLLGSNAAVSAALLSNTGTIAGHGTVSTVSGLTNSGSIQFSGITDILGPVTNSNSLLVTGGGAGGPTTFYNAVANTGNISVSTGAAVVFLAAVTNTGTFTGPGAKIFDGGGGTSSLGSIDSVVGSTIVRPGAAITLNDFNEATVTVQGGINVNPNGTIANRTGNLTISAGSKLDLADNDLIVDYTGASPASLIRSYLLTGYNGGAWNGSGLVSAAGSSDASHRTALGYGDASDLGITRLDGQNITGPAVVVKYTYYGDSSLDGKVDLGNDFNLFLQGFVNHGAGWELGDYNYDGVVNATDFQLFINGFKSQGGSLGSLDAVIADSSLLSTAQKAQLLTAVPEPATDLIALVVCGFAFSRRSRRMRKS
jgi:T5SS/PEP-CTERM-associated repeat protein